MAFLSIQIDPHWQNMLAFFLLIIPVGLYIMGLYEDRKGTWLMGAGLLVHLLSILERWAYTGLIPLSEKRDNISLMTFAMACIYLHLRRRGVRDLSLYALPLITAMILVAVGHRAYDSITPFMQTHWFYLHVLFYFMAYAFFGISAALCVQYMLSGQTEHEALGYRLGGIGWVLLSASLMFGSLWFYMAYGTYWLWTSKELWITITWLFYGLYLHARLIKGLRGRPGAALGVAAFALALFTYFGVGTVIKAPPTQF